MVVILLLVPSSTSSSTLTTTTTYTNSVSISQTTPKYSSSQAPSPSKYYCYGSQPLTHHQSTSLSAAPNKNFNREYVNHVTRINICSQIEASSNGEREPEAVVKEGE